MYPFKGRFIPPRSEAGIGGAYGVGYPPAKRLGHLVAALGGDQGLQVGLETKRAEARGALI